MNAKLMETMTWDEIEDAIKKCPFVLIPLGAKQKEHGYHLPMNTDYLLAKYFRDRLLEQFEVLAAAAIDINFYPAFTEYPGTEHLHLETAINLVYEKCKSYANHGITHIYVINMGFSTNKVLQHVQEKIKGDKVSLHYTDLSKYKTQAIKNIETQSRGTHADEIETSMMLYIRSDVVRMDKAIKDDNDEINPQRVGPLTRNPNASFGVFSRSGAWGDPTKATVEKGKIIVEEYIKLLNQEVSALLQECLKQKETKRTTELTAQQFNKTFSELKFQEENEDMAQERSLKK